MSSRDGDVLVLRAETPRAAWLFGYAHLDLDVVLPDTLPVEIEDGSGDIDVTDVGGGVRIGDDASGGIGIEDVRGDVRIDEDGSGDVDVRRVAGDFVFLRDGSGSVRYADVAGTVEVP